MSPKTKAKTKNRQNLKRSELNGAGGHRKATELIRPAHNSCIDQVPGDLRWFRFRFACRQRFPAGVVRPRHFLEPGPEPPR